MVCECVERLGQAEERRSNCRSLEIDLPHGCRFC
jgi:hypothetical protein